MGGFNKLDVSHGEASPLPFELSVSTGKYPGYGVIQKFGENPDIDPNTTPEDIWEVGGLYTYDADGTDPIRYVSSNDILDTGQTIRVEGLDIDGNLVAQDVITDGQDVVNLTTPLWRCFRAMNNSAFGNDLHGMLFIHTDPAPSLGTPAVGTIRAEIDNGNNQTLMALYTVPLGLVGFLYKGEIGLSRAQSTGAIRASSYSRRFGKIFQVKRRIAISNSGTSIFKEVLIFPGPIPALTDVKFTVESVTALNTGVFGSFDIMLVDETRFPVSYLQSIGQPGF